LSLDALPIQAPPPLPRTVVAFLAEGGEVPGREVGRERVAVVQVVDPGEEDGSIASYALRSCVWFLFIEMDHLIGDFREAYVVTHQEKLVVPVLRNLLLPDVD
jgi:hypothetical protein